MLTAEEILEEIFSVDQMRALDNNPFLKQKIIRAMRIYRNQAIQQASEVCCETLTDGFRISNIPAVLALKEEV